MTQDGQRELVFYLGRAAHTFALPDAGRVSVGRAPENDIQVDDPSVSRHHLCLHVGATIQVEDLGSANGTYVVQSLADAQESDDDRTRRNKDALGSRLSVETPVPLKVRDSLRLGSVFAELQVRERVARSIPPGPATPEAPLFGDTVTDPRMIETYQLALRVARSDLTVLLTGETGVGKEILAETIHTNSSRATKPFLRLNCAALSESLLESELFGHERGAFTGALRSKNGLLEATNGGTVFLDEIGELPAGIQAKMLRVLEERRVTRVGSSSPRPIDVRFLAATNRDLKQDVALGKFRKDLLFRINAVAILLPPLRERLAEIAPLANYFLKQFCQKNRLRLPTISELALVRLRDHAWPGNVRELKNVIERAAFVHSGKVLLPEHFVLDEIPFSVLSEGVPPTAADSTDLDVTNVMPMRVSGSSTRSLEISHTVSLSAAEDERQRVLAALASCGGNQTRAAKLLGFSRRTLVNRLRDYNLPRPKKPL
jgi:two-component system response regulator AtoC